MAEGSPPLKQLLAFFVILFMYGAREKNDYLNAAVRAVINYYNLILAICPGAI